MMRYVENGEGAFLNGVRVQLRDFMPVFGQHSYPHAEVMAKYDLKADEYLSVASWLCGKALLAA